MARVNISLPDDLQARIERSRDRINVSKVCAAALERELNMLEAKPSAANPHIARLIERLQGRSERWYQNGYDDATQWAVEHATRQDLQQALDFAGWDDEELSDRGDELPGIGPGYVRTDRVRFYYAKQRAEQRVASRFGLKQVPALSPSPEYDEARADIDPLAYVKGWRDALCDLWKVLSPSLK
jgi:hypothetical protein